jgi:3-deoxy-D-manno-octulosonic-acid transferase
VRAVTFAGLKNLSSLLVIFYNIFLLLFRAGTNIASLFNPKAKKWLKGRTDIFTRLRAAIPENDQILWMHCASLGEFEQGRPVLEKLRQYYPGYKILLTFFSPSGYEVQKNYSGADWVFYLPADGAGNARRFLDIVHPSLVIFVKYEFWYYYLKKIKYRNIPLLLVSAVFRKDMSSFRWFSGLQLKMLSRFNHVFLQNESSKKMLDQQKAGSNYSVAGDTRFDRVIKIAENPEPVAGIEHFCDQKKILVAGSTWPEDEIVISKITVRLKQYNMKLIIAPHEVHSDHLKNLKTLFPDSILYSQLAVAGQVPVTSHCLIIDNIGMLSRLYRYAYISFVGGGFRPSGVHNVTEAAVYGKPVLTGPHIFKYAEAVELVNTGGGFMVDSEEAMKNCIEKLMKDETELYNHSSNAAYNYIRKNAGAADKIIRFIQENRLLTS